jgi:tetratricopeptide (TPR) repeat protein
MKKLLTIILCSILIPATLAAQPYSQSARLLREADSLYLQNSWTGAKERYLAYVKDTSLNALAWNRLATCNYRLGLYDDAETNFQRALTCNPPPPVRNVIESRLAKTYAVRNQPDLALTWLEKATASGYANLQDLDSSAEFQAIRTTPRFKDLYHKIYLAVFPCVSEPRSQDFNFWIGEWDVYITGTNALAGHSVIQQISGGCALLENWTSGQNGTGKSINYYDTTVHKWEQDWIGSDGEAQHFFNGEYQNGMMHFTYSKIINGGPINGNFIFYNINKDTVRQYQDVADKNGKIVSVTYDLTYIRKK